MPNTNQITAEFSRDMLVSTAGETFDPDKIDARMIERTRAGLQSLEDTFRLARLAFLWEMKHGDPLKSGFYEIGARILKEKFTILVHVPELDTASEAA